MKIHAFATEAAGKPLQPFEYEPSELGLYDVEVAISHCGICHSDVHLVDDDWQMSTYPLVPGHEIVGTVQAVGRAVRNLETGQRVGIGWLRSTCLACAHCLAGEENLCPEQEATCMGHYGGFADRIRTDSRFVYPLPEKLPSESAAPLLCAGVTVYAPLRRHARPHMKVGVIGIGGLGHLALQFARAFGCEVTAFSSSEDKAADAQRLGAHHFVTTQAGAPTAEVAPSLDLILNTVHVDLNWPAFVEALRPNGILCTVGAGATPIAVPPFALLGAQKSLTGSVTGGRKLILEMLEFAARHDIRAHVQLAPMSDADAALDKVRRGEARYRMVLQN